MINSISLNTKKEKIKENNEKFNQDTFNLSWKLLFSIMKTFTVNNPEKARKKAREETIKFYRDLERDYWIDFSIKFSEEAKNNFPNIVDEIDNYIKTWECTSLFPVAWLWNHTLFWNESTWFNFTF